MRILVYSCIREVDRKKMRVRSQSCAARPQEKGRHSVSKIRRTVSMKITVEDSERGNTAAMREVEDSQSKERN